MDSTELCEEVLAQLGLTDAEIRKHIVFIDLAKPGGRKDPGCLPRFNMMETSDGNEDEDEFVKLTARISVFEMLFDGLLDNQTTPPQRTMMSMAAQTLAYVEDPSVHDLTQLLRDPFEFIDRIEGLEPIIDNYWRDEFVVKTKNGIDEVACKTETAGALLRRVNGLLGTPIVKRLLVNDHPTISLAKRMNEGGVFVMVATRKGKVMPAGARLVGRFMLTMIHRAVGARNSLRKPVPTFVAIDEFHNYLVQGSDEALLNLLAEARKHRCSVWLLHQEERQLSPPMLNSLLTNCHVITSGQMSDAMARLSRDKLGITTIENGPDKGKLTIETTKMPLKSFVAGVRGKPPIVIKSRKDPLGDRFKRLPGDGGAAVLKRTHALMREEYAHIPVIAADNVVELQEARPI